MTAVASRWFIPIFVAAFVVAILALRAYFSTTEDPRPRRAIGRLESAIVHPSPSDRPVRRARPASPRHRSRVIGIGQLAADLARRLDDLAVRTRSNLSRSTPVLFLRGRFDHLSGEPRAAIGHFDQLLARQPDNVPALLSKAAAHLVLGELDEAADAYRHVLRLVSTSADARYNLGVLLCRGGRFDEASDQFRALVRAHADHTRGQHNLAVLAQNAGRISEARDAWLASTRLQPELPEAWFNLGVIWLDYDRPLDAATCFARVTALSPADPDAWLNLAHAYSLAGDLDAALHALDTAEDLAPCNPVILRRLADHHRRMAAQRPDDATHHLDLAVRWEDQIDPTDTGSPAAPTLVAGPPTD